ncbi:MAG: hypothetical protein KDD67_01195 [Ignavibacteriae bacterium]|nr:hypothetical protein [Ignavibacteriota bacterium]MCB9217663.1 hypothetical protein [Ignavibacteria bacterium]
MAKQQSFVDKVNKRGAGSDLIPVKVIVASKTDKGSYRFNEKFIKVKDLSEVEKVVKGE